MAFLNGIRTVILNILYEYIMFIYEGKIKRKELGNMKCPNHIHIIFNRREKSKFKNITA